MKRRLAVSLDLPPRLIKANFHFHLEFVAIIKRCLAVEARIAGSARIVREAVQRAGKELLELAGPGDRRERMLECISVVDTNLVQACLKVPRLLPSAGGRIASCKGE